MPSPVGIGLPDLAVIGGRGAVAPLAFPVPASLPTGWSSFIKFGINRPSLSKKLMNH